MARAAARRCSGSAGTTSTMSWWVHWAGPSRGSCSVATPRRSEDHQSARAVGRRVQLPIEDEAAAMHFAMAFWDLMRLATLALWVASLVVLAVDRRLFDGPFLTVSLVIAGAMFASAVGYFITFLHRSKLAETDESWVDGDGNQHLVRFGTPKPYDALIVIGTGILTVAVGLDLT